MADSDSAGNGALWSTFLAAFIAAIGTLTMGYGQGYSSTTLDDLAQRDRVFAESSSDSQLFTALMPVGALLASPVAGALSDWIGRKTGMIISQIPGVAGWIMIAVSPYITNPLAFKWMILSGRFLTGISIGWVAVASPYYTAEIAVSKYRGLLTAFYHFSVIAGIFFSFGVGTIPGINYSHSALVIAGIIIIFEILTITVIPESPRWLLAKGHEARALKALRWLRRSEEIAREEASDIEVFIKTIPKLSLKEKLHEFRKKHVFVPVILMLTLMFFNQFSGMVVIAAYAVFILEAGGIGNPRVIAFCSFGVFQLIAAFTSSAIVDRVGRKTLLILSGIGITIGNVGLGTFFYISGDCGENNTSTSFLSNATYPDEDEDTDTCSAKLAFLAIGSLTIFSFMHGLGWRCVPSIMRAEVYPLRLRGILGGLNDFVGWSMIALAVGTYYPYEKAVGEHGAWWSLAALSFVGIFFVIAFIPETKGKTLEEIEMHFKTTARTRNLQFEVDPKSLINRKELKPGLFVTDV